MRKVLISAYIFTIAGLLMGRGFAEQASSLSNINEHLIQYSAFNQIHHDNIDDESHVHSHKHSENGEEHEHHHEHNKVSHNEVQLTHSDECIITTSFVDIEKNNFMEKNHFSNSYPNELFRPPAAQI